MPSTPGRSNGVSPKRRANDSGSLSSSAARSGSAISWRTPSSASLVGRANFTFHGQTSWHTSQPNSQSPTLRRSASSNSPACSMVR